MVVKERRQRLVRKTRCPSKEEIRGEGGSHIDFSSSEHKARSVGSEKRLRSELEAEGGEVG